MHRRYIPIEARHRGADGGDIEGGKRCDDFFEGREHFLPRHRDFGVLGADIVRDLPRVFKVDGVLLHADGEGADGLLEGARPDGADEGTVQPARKQKSERGVAVQPLFDSTPAMSRSRIPLQISFNPSS